MKKLKILIADDDIKIRNLLSEHLSREYEVYTAYDGYQAFEIIADKEIDIILLDIKMPGMDGMKLLRKLYQRQINVLVIMISGHGTIKDAVEATRLGAFEFIEKPFKAETVIQAIKRSEKSKKLREFKEKSDVLDKIVGNSEFIKELKEKIKWIAPSNCRVLITGENGTGKELVAEAVHKLSLRKNGPFVTVNCGAIPTELFESELFGHKKGSFTGAYYDYDGKIVSANNGTIFFDEIGELPLHMQVKLLRVFETGTVQKIGETFETDIDVRVICATNKNLEEEISKGKFRQDLYYRFNVVEIHLRPLRERAEDILLLFEHFLNKTKEKDRIPLKSLTPDALAYLMQYQWNGNVRELRNFVERIVNMPSGEQISRADILKFWKNDSNKAVFTEEKNTSKYKPFHDAKREFEKSYITQALKDHNGRVAETAKALELDRSWLYRKMKELEIDTGELIK